jgi:arginyl-tRNA synthetase
VITRDLRRAIARAVAAAGFDQAADPGLRPTGVPGQYAASVALTLGPRPREAAGTLAVTLAEAGWIASAEVTGPGYLTITVTPAALAAVADTVTKAGPGCVTSDALAGLTVAAPPPGDPLNAAGWDDARAALAAVLTARLAAAAGATVPGFADSERMRLTAPQKSDSVSGVSRPRSDDPQPAPGAGPRVPDTGPDAGPRVPDTGLGTEVAATVAFAGRDAVVFSLARVIPGKTAVVDRRIIARQVPANPAYAVRYAHARAASGVRWAATSSAAAVPGTEAAPRCPPADPGVLALLDALSWLPERVATAARRGRPDEFARYLEDLASVTVDVLSSARHPGNAGAPGSDRLAEARAARTGLAAGLGLLGVSAPDRM